MSLSTGYLDGYRSVGEVLARAYRMLELTDAAGRTSFGGDAHSNMTVRDVCTSFRTREVGQPFTVAVVGEFNTGKSSLLNVLLGQINPNGKGSDGILPTAMRATTATVTRLEHNAELKFGVLHDDGVLMAVEPRIGRALLADPSVWHKIDPRLDRASVERMVCGIHEVRIGLPSRLLKSGICIVDTPGLGSTNSRHSQITSQYLTHADAALFLVATDPPMGESEMLFLERASRLLSKFLFVQTKADIGERSERGEPLVVARAREHRRRIAEVLGHDRFELHTVSAQVAAHGIRHRDEATVIASQLYSLEAALDRFLGSHSAMDRLQSWVLRLERCEALCRQSLELEAAALQCRLDDLAHTTVSDAELEAWQVAADAYQRHALAHAATASRAVMDARTPVATALQQYAMTETAKLKAIRTPSEADVMRAGRGLLHRARVELDGYVAPVVITAIGEAQSAAKQALEANLPKAAHDLLLNLDLIKVAETGSSVLDARSILHVETKAVAKDGFWASVARLFGLGGYEDVSTTKVRGDVLTGTAESIATESVVGINGALGDALRQLAAAILAEMGRAQAAAKQQREQADRARNLDMGECRTRLAELHKQGVAIGAVSSMRQQAIDAMAKHGLGASGDLP
jgi:GTP-binding protein EngB required for normal cell division